MPTALSVVLASVIFEAVDMAMSKMLLFSRKTNWQEAMNG
jgi:hypothetical protein